MDIHKIYTDILTSYNILTVFKGDVNNKRIKYMKEHGLDIEVYDEMKTPGVDSIKYIIE